MDINAKHLEEIVARALERSAFVYVEPGGETDQHDHHARISFDGDGSSGDIFLSADQGFVRELASNLLGADLEQVSTTEGIEALSELANMVAGEVISLLGARTSPIQLGLPSSVEAIPEPAADACTAHLFSDFGSIQIHYQARKA